MGKIKITPTNIYANNHPLLMDVIVHIVFDTLDFTDLKNARSVCHFWSAVGLKKLKKRAKLVLTKKNLHQFMQHEHQYPTTFSDFTYEVSVCNEQEVNFLLELNPRSLTLHTEIRDIPTLVYKHLETILRSCNSVLTYLDACVSWESRYQRDPEFPDFVEYPQEVEPLLQLLKEVQFPNLRKLRIPWETLRQYSPLELPKVWVELIKVAPLNYLSIVTDEDEEDDEICNQIAELDLLKHLDTLELLGDPIHWARAIGRMRTADLKHLILRLKIGESDIILNRVAHSLETLEFTCPINEEFAPLRFPVMKKLKYIKTGSTLLSFPTITPDKLPVLEKVDTMYWDWKWSNFLEIPPFTLKHTENTDHPPMENFPNYCDRIAAKFPNMNIIRLNNVCKDPLTRSTLGVSVMGEIIRALGIRLKEISVCSYQHHPLFRSESETDILVPLNSKTCPNLEVIDLNPTQWVEVFKRKPSSSVHSVDFESLSIFNDPDTIQNLRVVKLLWIAGMRLVDFVTKYPNLEILEVIGGRCINRMDRYKMKKACPRMTFVQHPCLCSAEDVWFMSEPDGYLAFQNLYA